MQAFVFDDDTSAVDMLATRSIVLVSTIKERGFLKKKTVKQKCLLSSFRLRRRHTKCLFYIERLPPGGRSSFSPMPYPSSCWSSQTLCSPTPPIALSRRPSERSRIRQSVVSRPAFRAPPARSLAATITFPPSLCVSLSCYLYLSLSLFLPLVCQEPVTMNMYHFIFHCMYQPN